MRATPEKWAAIVARAKETGAASRLVSMLERGEIPHVDGDGVEWEAPHAKSGGAGVEMTTAPVAQRKWELMTNMEKDALWREDLETARALRRASKEG